MNSPVDAAKVDLSSRLSKPSHDMHVSTRCGYLDRRLCRGCMLVQNILQMYILLLVCAAGQQKLKVVVEARVTGQVKKRAGVSCRLVPMPLGFAANVFVRFEQRSA